MATIPSDPTTQPLEPPTVGELLAQANGAHHAYRAELGALHPNTARTWLAQAQSLRQQAQDADPDHLDAVWAAQEAAYPHAALMAFYAEQLALPPGGRS